MSTRSNIKVIDDHGSILLYKHHDGYAENMIPFLTPYVQGSGKSAEWLANQMIENSEVEVSCALHGDIEYYYEIYVMKNKIKVYKVDMSDESQELQTIVEIPEKVAA